METRKKIIFGSVDEYISSLPAMQREMIQSLRKIIKQEVPQAVEAISYNMPAYRYKGILCYYAAHSKHIGFYPASAEAITVFQNDLKEYRTSKGTVQFQYGTIIPEELVRKIVRYRLGQKSGRKT